MEDVMSNRRILKHQTWPNPLNKVGMEATTDCMDPFQLGGWVLTVAIPKEETRTKQEGTKGRIAFLGEL